MQLLLLSLKLKKSHRFKVYVPQCVLALYIVHSYICKLIDIMVLFFIYIQATFSCSFSSRSNTIWCASLSSLFLSRSLNRLHNVTPLENAHMHKEKFSVRKSEKKKKQKQKHKHLTEQSPCVKLLLWSR